MLVTPLPGVNRDDVPKTLREIASAAGNAHGAAYSRLMAYLEWATASERMLAGRLTRADIDHLVLTRGYERLLAAAGSLTGVDMATQRVLNGMVYEELRQRASALDGTIRDLGAQIARWSGGAVFTVADTSVYIEHEDKLRDLDFASLLPGWQDQTVRVIIPLVILDELDGLKRTGDARRRWRAGYTLAVMEDALASQPVPGLLRAPSEDFTRG